MIGLRRCSDSVLFPARILTSAGKAALAEWVKVITPDAKVVMEAMMQLTPVVWLIVVWGHTLVLHPPTQAQRHINVYSFIVCETQTDTWIASCGQSWFDMAPTLLFLQDLAEFLEQIGFSKYLPLLEEQDIDLRIFLTLTENDLKEIGIT